MTTIVLTTGTSWTVPGDFDPAANTIYVWGGGGGGAGGKGGQALLDGQGRPGNGGGGGGELRILTNFDPGVASSIPYTIGAGGAGGPGSANSDTDPTAGSAGGESTWNTSSAVAEGGGGGAIGAGSTPGTGGASGTGGSGGTGQNGGAGGAGGARSLSTGGGGGGGGGAGGTTGAGGTGGTGLAGSTGGAGGAGGATSGGTAGTAGTFPGGAGGVGGDGTVIDGTDGAGAGGGGGGGGANTGTGGAGAVGGDWGAGGGSGGGGGAEASGGNGAAGKQGAIIIVYTPTAGTNEGEADFAIPALSMSASGTTSGTTVPVITLTRSTYTTAPHHFYARSDSSVIGGDGTTYNARYFWLLETAAGAEIARGYLPEFSRGIETPGDYVLHLGIQGDGESVMQYDSAAFTVGTASYAAECWVDLDAVSDGVGTEIDPFNSLPSAWDYINTNWVAGASSEHAIHVKKGTSATIGSALFGDNLQGRVVIDTYGTGAKPALTFTSVVIRWLHTIDHMSVVLNGFTVVGSETWPNISSSQFIQSTVDQANTPDGHNLMLLNCDFSLLPGIYVNGTIVDGDYYTDGTSDFVLLQNNTWDQCFVAALFQDVQYLTIVGDEHGEMSSTYWIRRGGFRHTYQCDTNQTAQYGGSVSYRLHAHANSGSFDSDGAYLERCRAIGPWWIGPDDGNGGAVNDLLNVFMLGCTVGDGTQPSSPFGGAAFQPNGIGVLRNCIIRRGLNDGAPCLYVRPNLNADNMSVLVLDHCVFLRAETGTASPTICSYSAVTIGTVILRNNVLWTASTGGTITWFNADGSSPYGVTVSDGNVADSGGATINWWPSTSLAAWQAATVFDDNSLLGSDPDFVEPTTPPVDVTPNAGSPVLDAGVASPAWVDFNGFLRSDPPDAGAVERGASVEPSLPAAGSGEASGAFAIPALTMSASGVYEHQSTAAFTIPALGMAAAGTAAHDAQGDFVIPTLGMSARIGYATGARGIGLRIGIGL